MDRLTGFIAAGTVALCMTLSTVQAALVIAPGSASLRTDMTGTVGFDFTLNESIEVDALGFIDIGGDGLGSAHTVGLWGPDGLVAEAVVPAGTDGTLIDGYRYQSLASSITLLPDTLYTLGANVFLAGDSWRDSGDVVTFDSRVASTTARWTQEGTGGYTRPTNFGNGSGYMAPNLQIVPEPAMLSAVALGGLLMLRRRRA